MNVNDINLEVVPTDFSVYDRLDWIFSRQHALSQKYIDIETRNGLRWSPQMPVDLDDRFGQATMKDFFWRVTEELTESVQALIDHPDNPTHAIEELADTMHFLIEAYLLAGMAPSDLVSDEGYTGCKLAYLFNNETPTDLRAGAYNVIHCIGCASNCLKQRPWKCTHQLLDRKQFTFWLRSAIHDLIPIFKLFGLTVDQVFTMYFKKSEVNSFRIRSNY